MTDLFSPPQQPVVTITDGKCFANSRNVAAYFEKRHADVLHDLDNLLKNMPDADLRSGLFVETSYADANGQERRCVEMSRDGFTLVAMSFTGPKATEFKLRYMAQFCAVQNQRLEPIPARKPRAAPHRHD